MVKRLLRRWYAHIPDWLDMRGHFFYKLIGLGLISACIPIIVAGTVYYQISVKAAYEKTEEESRISLKFVIDRFETLLAGLELESFNLALDPSITEFVADNRGDEPYLHSKRLLAALDRKKNTNDMISEILLYHAHSNSLHSTYYGQIRQDVYYQMKDIHYLLDSQNQSTLMWAYLPEARKDGYISLVRKLPLMTKGTDRLIFHIRTDQLKSYMNDSFFYFPNKSLLILDSGGSALFQLQERQLQNEELHVQNIKRIVADPLASGVFLAQGAKGREMLYSYKKTPSGRIYISLIPREEFSKQLGWIRWVTLASVLSLITMAVLLTFFNSLRVYTPIQQLLKQGKSLNLDSIPPDHSNELSYIRECLNYLNRETKTLSTYLRTMEPNLRERFFQKLFDKGYTNQSLLLKDCSDLGIQVAGHYMVLVVELENVHKEKRFLPDDKSILGFAIANVMGELLDDNKALEGYTLSLRDGRGVAVLSGRDLSALPQEAYKYAVSMCNALERYLKFKVAVGIGGICAHISDVVLSYEEALTALQYRLIEDSKPVIYIEDLENPRKKMIAFYPQKEVDVMVAALTAQDEGAAVLALKSFSQAVRLTQSKLITYQAYHLLLASLIQSVEQHGGSVFHVLESNLFDQLKERKTSTEICDWFADVIFPLVARIAAENDVGQLSKSRGDIKRICQYIRDNIHSDISLTQCAEMLGMTPPYISRVFKKMMGFSFVEYVMNCKMEEAKRMLLETDCTLQEIAASIGYTERNLSRVFQRYNRLTPGQFRASHR